ncbi:hypothetical protein PROFUN_03783 [Planoprotostelium fungivorum]|uniref:Protein kinase domain-containing protein n=1 Tax=Planoprotostelium fungivorum TaxID=1890364 RepID=A0A2P6NDP8_9EUKA|nr:hypothetical protein PROFUN_03783 [Planoprotostelium fungivorum]
MRSLTTPLFLLLFMFLCSSDAFPTDPRTLAALRELNVQTKGEGWRHSDNWNTGDDYCNYFGITCYNDGTIDVKLPSNRLIGKALDFPKLFDLRTLRSLDLSDNAIAGNVIIFDKIYLTCYQLPNFTRDAAGIKFISFRGCDLEGSIPSSIEHMTHLDELYLSGNQLTHLPNSISSLSSLRVLDLSFNSINKIPDTLGSMESLVTLRLQKNGITGSFPTVAGWDNLQDLNLASNNFSGAIPSLRGCVNLTRVNLAHNRLSVVDKKAFFYLQRLRYLDLSFNSFFGSMPRLPSTISSVQLNNNLFFGDLHEFLTDLSNFTSPRDDLLTIDVSNNHLTGTLPEAMGDIPHLSSFKASQNVLEGGLPDMVECGKLSELDLSDNHLTAVNWTRLDACNALATLDLSNNSIGGDVDSLPRSGVLSALDVSYNRISAVSLTALPSTMKNLDAKNNKMIEIPKGIYSANLECLDLSWNQIQDSLTYRISEMSNLQHLDLSHNFIEDSIPRIIGDLNLLRHMDFSWNKLSGSIPSSLYTLPRLIHLDLSHNQLTSSLYQVDRPFPELTHLDLSDNRLSGEIPQDFETMGKLIVANLSHNSFGGRLFSTHLMRTLTIIDVSHNTDLSGSVTKVDADVSTAGEIGVLGPDVEHIDFSHCDFTGSTEFLSDRPMMTYADISHNRFDGPIRYLPGALNYLDISSNNLSALPDIVHLESIQYLNISNNELDGDMPKLTSAHLTTYDASNNLFDTLRDIKSLPPSVNVCRFDRNPLKCPISWEAWTKCNTRCTVDNGTERVWITVTRETTGSKNWPEAVSERLARAYNITYSRLHIQKENDRLEYHIDEPKRNFNEWSSKDLTQQMSDDWKDHSNLWLANYNVTRVELSLPQENHTALIASVSTLTPLFVVTAAILFVYLRRRWRRADKNKHRKKFEKVELIDEFEALTLWDIQVQGIIGQGHFGQVYRGLWNNTTVALKTMETEHDDMKKAEWKKEIVLLQKLNHPNIVRLFGVYDLYSKLYMVVEFAENGSLDVFLQKRTNANRLSNNDLIRMCLDVVKGMCYLSSRRIIHRDLAARNLLLDGSLRVKISDFGMSRMENFYESRSRVVPIRWAAPEMYLRHHSSLQSDVWSFGVCMWEIMTFGSIPYEDYSNKEVIKLVVDDNYRLPQPPRCPEDLYGLMLQCWQIEPEERPCFQTIYEQIVKENPEKTDAKEQIDKREEEEKHHEGGLLSRILTSSGGDSIVSWPILRPNQSSGSGYTDEDNYDDSASRSRSLRQSREDDGVGETRPYEDNIMLQSLFKFGAGRKYSHLSSGEP